MTGWVLRGAALVVSKQSGMTASGLVHRGGWVSPDLALSVLGSFLLPQGWSVLSAELVRGVSPQQRGT